MADKLIHTFPNTKQNEHSNVAGSTKVFGFWIYLMSDCILFCCLFATYAVLMKGTADGPTGKEIFKLPFILIETVLLLLSSITYGMATIAVDKNNNQLIFWLVLTYLLGASFIGMETFEFHQLIMEGFCPDRSGFLSAFFTTISIHALHVIAGLIWMMVLILQIYLRGLTSIIRTRITCLNLFWHFLDIVWICVFSIVYLIGSIS